MIYAATARLPDQIDEILFTGFLRKKGVELVKGITATESASQVSANGPYSAFIYLLAGAIRISLFMRTADAD